MTPAARLTDRLVAAASGAFEDRMSLGETAAVTLQLALKLMIGHLGEKGTVIMLRNLADSLEGPEPANLQDLTSINPEGSA